MNKKILTYGTRGCLGDLQFAIFAIQAYKKKHKDHQIYLSWKTEEFLPLAYHNSDITAVTPWKDVKHFVTDDFAYHLLFQAYDEVYNIGDELTCAYEAKHHPPKKSRIEILCRNLDNSYLYVEPKVYLSSDEIKYANDYKKKLGKKFIIGIVSRTHSQVRSYDNFDRIHELLPNDVYVLVFKKYNLDWTDNEWDYDRAELFVDLPIRKVLALFSICDVVIGCDTGPTHSAAGLGIPTIWLFGCTDGRLATKEYKNATAIQKMDSCPHIPCWYSLECEKLTFDNQFHCIKDISPTEIVKEIMPLYKKWRV
jgi:ADP-heptose:LPS heptosyltransferase